MSVSPSGSVALITSLVPHFDEDNVCEFKKHLLKVLDCENQSIFAGKGPCQVLRESYKSVSHESITQLKHETIKMAEQQQHHPSSSSSSQHQVSVYKYVQQQWHDPLSLLHSNIIDYLGTFLTKDQSIALGYLNTHLYMEMNLLNAQTQNYPI